MLFKTPKFWRQKPGLLSCILLPVSYIYKLVSKILPCLKTPWKAPITVICVGNHVVGGAGKTPVVQAVAKYITEYGLKPHIASRGYGGKVTKVPCKVNNRYDTADKVGDEPLLHSEIAPTWVCTNRKRAILAAYETGATHIILDDGLQDNSIKKDFNILVLDPPYGFANTLPFPAGPLRESLRRAMLKSDIALSFEDIEGVDSTKISLETKLEGNCKDVIGFAGIGRPEKFKASLESYGCNVIEFHEFPDHYNYNQKDLVQLIAKAKQNKATLVTTKKDYVRTPKSLRQHIRVMSACISEFDIASLLASVVENK